MPGDYIQTGGGTIAVHVTKALKLIAKSKLKGLPQLRSGIIDVSDTWLQ